LPGGTFELTSAFAACTAGHKKIRLSNTRTVHQARPSEHKPVVNKGDGAAATLDRECIMET